MSPKARQPDANGPPQGYQRAKSWAAEVIFDMRCGLLQRQPRSQPANDGKLSQMIGSTWLHLLLEGCGQAG